MRKARGEQKGNQHELNYINYFMSILALVLVLVFQSFVWLFSFNICRWFTFSVALHLFSIIEQTLDPGIISSFMTQVQIAKYLINSSNFNSLMSVVNGKWHCMQLTSK